MLKHIKQVLRAVIGICLGTFVGTVFMSFAWWLAQGQGPDLLAFRVAGLSAGLGVGATFTLIGVCVREGIESVQKDET